MKKGEWIPHGEHLEMLKSTPYELVEVRFDNGMTVPYLDKKWPFSMVTHWRIAPKQILTYDKFGQVDGGFINPKWEEWERENKLK